MYDDVILEKDSNRWLRWLDGILAVAYLALLIIPSILVLDLLIVANVWNFPFSHFYAPYFPFICLLVAFLPIILSNIVLITTIITNAISGFFA